MPVTLNSVVQVVIFLVVLLLLTKPMGLYLTRVFAGERTWLTLVFAPVERLFYKLSGVNPEEEQKWTGYVIAMLLFSVAGMLLLYLIERTQQWLPFQPAGHDRCRAWAGLQHGSQLHD
jgi:K+-transporting ATPase ATPase A chain